MTMRESRPLKTAGRRMVRTGDRDADAFTEVTDTVQSHQLDHSVTANASKTVIQRDYVVVK